MNLLAARRRPPSQDDGQGRHVAAAWRADGGSAWLAAAASLVLAGTAVLSRKLVPDTFYDLYDGRYIVRHGIGYRNLATVAAHGAPAVDQQWLAHLGYYAAWAVGGYPAVALASAMLVAAGFTVIGLAVLARGTPPPRMFAWLAAAFLACQGIDLLVVQAQSFGYLFFAITVWLIAADKTASARPSGRVFLIVPVLVVWANAHGSVALGAALAVCYAASRMVRAIAGRDRGAFAAYLGLAAASAGAVLCTPYGTSMIGYYVTFTRPVLARHLVGFRPLDIASPLDWPFFALVAAVAAAVVIALRRGARPDPVLAGLALILLCFAADAERYKIFFALGGILLASDCLARPGTADPAAGVTAPFRRAITAALAGLAVASVAWLAVTPQQVFESFLPARALSVAAGLARRDPGARVLCDLFSETPMLWLHPAMFGRVAFDIRMEQYTPAELSGYFDFLFARGPRWQRITAGYDLIVVDRRIYGRLGAAVTRLPGWRLVYADRTGVVMRRQP